MTNPTITEQDLIARLEKATGPDRILWDEVNDYAWTAHWIDTARHLVNRTLIEQAFALPDGNLLLAVALTLVPKGTALCIAALRASAALTTTEGR